MLICKIKHKSALNGMSTIAQDRGRRVNKGGELLAGVFSIKQEVRIRSLTTRTCISLMVNLINAHSNFYYVFKYFSLKRHSFRNSDFTVVPNSVTI